jgi:hypothetical protein
MQGISLSSLRVGKKYRLVNFGDRYDFIIETIISNSDFLAKDLHTLERYQYKDLVKFGKGKDYELRELFG